MKTYKHLFEKATEIEEINLAYKDARKHKTRRAYVRRFELNKDENLEHIRQKLINKEWTPPHHDICILQEGPHKKERTIEKPLWDDEQIVHHILMRQFRKIVAPKIYEYSCGCVPGRGPHKLLRASIKWRNEYEGKRFYVAELDIKKCYDTIDLNLLKQKLKRIIKDDDYLYYINLIIDNGEQSKGYGLPKGFYTSPWFLNFDYIELDNFILQELKPDHYARYVDNMWLWRSNKKLLHRDVKQIAKFLKNEYHQELKEDWQVFRFQQVKDGKIYGRHINLLGFTIKADRVNVRKSILKRIRAKANRMRRKGRYTQRDCSAMISYMGYFKHSDSHRYYVKWVKPKVSIRYCKARIRGANKNDKLENSTRRC